MPQVGRALRASIPPQGSCSLAGCAQGAAGTPASPPSSIPAHPLAPKAHPTLAAAQAAAINTSNGHFVFLGEVAQRMVVSPDVEQVRTGSASLWEADGAVRKHPRTQPHAPMHMHAHACVHPRSRTPAHGQHAPTMATCLHLLQHAYIHAYASSAHACAHPCVHAPAAHGRPAGAWVPERAMGPEAA